MTQGDWGLNKGDFVSKTDALGSVARLSGESSDTKDLTAGRIHGASRDGKSGRNNGLEGGAARDGRQPDGDIRVDTTVEHVNHAHWGLGYLCRPITM